MGKFGWSYPPGCSGPPDEDVDDTICARCWSPLPEIPLNPPAAGEQETWEFNGFCDAVCFLGEMLHKALKNLTECDVELVQRAFAELYPGRLLPGHFPCDDIDLQTDED
jgi:hypothetical protein